ncbi:MAG: LPXTG cell wall anchor domain-containing protein [Clostridiaceae bacterium]|jgi:LPXTG-motif cell wall-anchored protein|nr:LPXTG cell wall anchor domain-containing protein [Clostridiaceae bacterium]
MKRRRLLALIVLCMLLTLFPTTVLADTGMLPPPIQSIAVDPIRAAACAEVRLYVWTAEPEGANWWDEQFTIADPGTTNATVTPEGLFLATSPGIATVKVRLYDEGRQGNFEQDVQITVFEPIIITTQSLPDGQVGVPYAVDLEATGSPNYWDPVNDLPPWLELHEYKGTTTLKGTPTVSGTYQVNVEASNNYTSAYAYLTIQITEAATPTSAPTSPTGSDPTGTDPTGTDPTGTDPDDASGVKMTQQPPVWRKGSNESASFTSNADIKDFLHVKVDEEIVDEANYVVKEGSTIVTFKPSFLETLSEGNHSVEIVSASGSAYGNIEIKAPTTPKTKPTAKPGNNLPSTGESSGQYPWLALLFLSALLLVLRKKRMSQQRD